MLRSQQLCAQAVAGGDGLVVLRARNQLLAHQRLQARCFRLGLAQLCLQAADLAACGGQLCGVEAALGVGVDGVECGHHLALFHTHAFFDHHLAHLARDLGRDRGHAPRHHIAAGIQHGRAAGAGLGHGHDRCGLHGDGGFAAEQGADDQGQQQRQDQAKHHPQPAAR
ncbi:hypothetical protein D3C81_948290 [compost metagenome]